MKAAAVGCGSWLARPGRSLASMKAYSSPVTSGTSRSMPGHRDADRLGRRHRDPTQFRIHLGGDIVDRAALMQVGGVANAQPSSLGAVHHPTANRLRRPSPR